MRSLSFLASTLTHQRRLHFSNTLLPTRSAITTSFSSAPFAVPPRFPPLVTPYLGRVAAFHANSEPVETATTPREEAKKEASLPPALRRESLPRHVAIVMDGNSRWARSRGLPSAAGHEAGYRALKNVIELSRLWGIGELTVFAFSYENWSRPKTEVNFPMMLFERAVKDAIAEFLNVYQIEGVQNRMIDQACAVQIGQGIRVCIIGDSSQLPKTLQRLINEAAEMSKDISTQLNLNVAIGYSGRWDITTACKRIARKVHTGCLEPEDITESHIAQELETSSNNVDPDLVIRTSGELRLSNFLLWQSAYSELYFTNAYWPDFDEAHYIEALQSFQSRKRRFGQRV